MSAPSSVFVTFHENGSPAVVSEYRDEAEAQNGQPATEYVPAAAVERATNHAHEINGRIIERQRIGLLQVIHERETALAEVASLRAALSEIAALQPRDPELAEIHYGDSNAYQRAVALFGAAEMARKGLVKL